MIKNFNPLLFAMTVLFFVSCKQNQDFKTNYLSPSQTNKDSLNFVIGIDTFKVAQNFIIEVVKAFPKVKEIKAQHPDSIFIPPKAYDYGEAQVDGLYLVYAGIQDKINTTNSMYDILVKDLIELNQNSIMLANAKLKKGSYFTHERVRLYAESVHHALQDQDIKNYNNFKLEKEKQKYFDSIRIDAQATFEELLPYEYVDTKEKEERLRQNLIETFNEVERFIDNDYKFKKFKQLYF